RYERMDTAFERDDWIATPAAQALLRNNRPLLAYIAGKPAAFTSKDHTFFPGETVEKQIIVINNSRETVTCDSQWSLGLPSPVTGNKQITVATGQQERIAPRFELPATLAPGQYELTATSRFSSGETQQDTFKLDVLPRPAPAALNAKVALFDPKGETTDVLVSCGMVVDLVDVGADLSGYDIFIVGQSALTPSRVAPDIGRVRDGLKVVIFEQTAEVLEKRFGFRVAEYGLRQAFPRVPDHPILAGLTTEHLRDWRGEASVLAPRLKYELRPRYGPTVQWCDIPVTRLWRCGNRGNVASVLIEKPARGDFLPILDGGFSLQYSPLLEYREGKGMVLFCQMDVTGRSESDPAAKTLARNLVQYVSAWKPNPQRKVVYAGDAAGKIHLQSAGIPVDSYDGGKLSPDQILVVTTNSAEKLRGRAPVIADWLKAGGNLLAIGLDAPEANTLLPFTVTMKRAEHISASFDPPGVNSLLAGVGSADVHNRDPQEFPLLSAGATILGDGVLAKAEDANVVFCQMAPWQFADTSQLNLKRTHRRAAFLVSRLLANMGAGAATPVLERFHQHVNPAKPEKRWLEGLYLDQPEEWDDPYRFFRW
ncbi:MAG TPA: hypothetical protein VFD27_05275, partial [Chthoniobacteraceae bacterium]|nr:hypothetical protein [Chthoniobacteraceae bacterium]